MKDDHSRYIEAVGRRKTSVARVRMTKADKNSILVNNKDIKSYFLTEQLQKIATEAYSDSKEIGNVAISAMVKGGGSTSQAEALRHAIARAMIQSKPELRPSLKRQGFLKRDPRVKERRKFGLKKARKAPQWSKR